jgi:hypothetical protein
MSNFTPLLNASPLRPSAACDLARLIRHDADGRINLLLDDLLGMFLGDFLDVHAALGAGHDERTRRGAIQQHREVKLLLDLFRRRDEQFADEPSVRAGLLGDEHLTEHGLGLFVNILDALAQVSRRPGSRS